MIHNYKFSLTAALLCLALLAGCGQRGQAAIPPENPPAESGSASSEAPGGTAPDASAPAESGQDRPAPSEEPLTAPPDLQVTYMEKTLTTKGWNWEWTVERADGTTETLYPEYATAHPLDWDWENADTFTRGGSDSVTLSFDVEPDSVSVYMDCLSGEVSGGDVALEPGLVVPLGDDPEGAIYTVHAVWTGTRGCTGKSAYAFCVKAQR